MSTPPEHSTPAPPPTTNWGRNVTYRAARLHQPTSVEEIARIVAAGEKVKALGTRHSFNTSADTTGDLISLAQLNRVVAIDELNRTVTVEAGITYGVLGRHLHERGFAVENLPSLPHVCVGGAVATGTHGSGTQNLSSAVVGLQLVTADGQINHYSRESAGDAFDGMVVSLGLLGVVTQLTLRIVPAFLIRQAVYEHVRMHDLLVDYDRLTASAYSVSLFTDWQSEAINEVWVKQRVESEQTPDATTDCLTHRKATVKLHPISGTSPEFCTEQGIAGPSYDRLPHFRPDHEPSSAGAELQSEYFIPRSDLPAAVDALRKIGPRLREQLLISEIRTIEADSLWLSGAYNRPTSGVHFTWKPNQPAVLQLLQDVLEPALSTFAARPHWGKLFSIRGQAVQSLYPMCSKFRELRSKLDPSDKLMNDFARPMLA